jgi:hypothetical protein
MKEDARIRIENLKKKELTKTEFKEDIAELKKKIAEVKKINH